MSEPPLEFDQISFDDDISDETINDDIANLMRKLHKKNTRKARRLKRFLGGLSV